MAGVEIPADTKAPAAEYMTLIGISMAAQRAHKHYLEKRLFERYPTRHHLIKGIRGELIELSAALDSFEIEPDKLHESYERFRVGFMNNPEEETERYSKEIHNTPSDELADIVLRALTMGADLGIDMGEAVLCKLMYNETRPLHHGKGLNLP